MKASVLPEKRAVRDRTPGTSQRCDLASECVHRVRSMAGRRLLNRGIGYQRCLLRVPAPQSTSVILEMLQQRGASEQC